MATNFKEKVQNLYNAMSKQEDYDDDTKEFLMDTVLDILESCNEYTKIVAEQEQRIQLASFRLDGQDFRDFVMDLDKQRRSIHESLMNKVNILNRISNQEGLGPVAEVNSDDRESYHGFAIAVCTEYANSDEVMHVFEE